MRFKFITLGNGKTFYIKQKLREAHIQETAVLCLDETFSRVSMIKKLRKLSTNSTKGLHLNFTIALTEVRTVYIIHMYHIRMFIESRHYTK